MKTTLPALLLFCLALVADAADQPARELFALYPIVAKETPNASNYEYEAAVDRSYQSGFYRGPAIITHTHIVTVQRDDVEMGAAPLPALAFRLTDAAIDRLREHLKQSKETELVAIIDGHAYATIKPAVIRRVVERRSALLIIFPSGDRHLIQLLIEKIEAGIKRK